MAKIIKMDFEFFTLNTLEPLDDIDSSFVQSLLQNAISKYL
jgi:hypothetical protein